MPRPLNDIGKDLGLEPDELVFFGRDKAKLAPSARARRRRPGEARIVLVRDGLTREFGFAKGDPSILDAAARAGLDVPYSCKSGVCATCRCKVLEGRVRMDRNFALEPADLEAGFVLSCQAHPLTPRVVVSFDAR